MTIEENGAMISSLISRRSLLIGAGATGSVVSIGPRHAHAALTVKMTNTTRRDDFLAFSRVLTGFGMDVLVDADDAAAYLQIFDAHAQAANVDAILYIYRQITAEMKMTPHRTVEAILAGTFDDRWPAWPLSKGTKSLLKLWYTGTWVSPSTDSDPVIIPSPQAYERGLVWLAAQAHPVGVSKLEFGHWEKVPPPLSEFVGDTV